jgi:molecular chaperone GrpE
MDETKKANGVENIPVTPETETAPEQVEQDKQTAGPAAPSAEDQLAELNDRYLRLAAEFDNYKKRIARDWVDRVRSANAEVLYELLEITDNFERALAIEHSDSAYTDGVKLILQQLQGLLARQGVEGISALGEKFNPSLHEALLHMESEQYAEGLVCQEIRKGYKLYDRVLRPAQVAVSKGKPNSSNEDTE